MSEIHDSMKSAIEGDEIEITMFEPSHAKLIHIGVYSHANDQHTVTSLSYDQAIELARKLNEFATRTILTR